MSSTEWIGTASLGVMLLGLFYGFVKTFSKVEDLLKWKEQKVDPHLENRSVHLDPARDEKRWDDLTKRLDKLEKKLDRVIELENRPRKQGDTDE